MRTISWLHISDFHLQDSQSWSQDIVLSAMCENIESYCSELGSIDFVLVTGDIVFSGKPHEYCKATEFFDEVVKVTGVPRERIFCVPGNHDVDRNRQKMCFTGARQQLQSQNEIDNFLESPEELQTLLQRQEAYCKFQEMYFSEQKRERIANGLGYVSPLAVEKLNFVIIGINTSWLSEGGSADHGKLLIGERQVIDALQIASRFDAHFVIAMGHHPFHLLNDFDRRSVQRHIESGCQFYHCGHLHIPEVEVRKAVSTGNHCLVVAAGASFESRQSHNSFSLVSLDVMKSQQSVTAFQYEPAKVGFSYRSETPLPFVINAVERYKLTEIRNAIIACDSKLKSVAYYLAALLNEVQTEMPFLVEDKLIFGSIDVLRDQPDNELKTASIAFIAVRNPLKLLAGCVVPREFMDCYGVAVLRYGKILMNLLETRPNAQRNLAERESAARTISALETRPVISHRHFLFQNLVSEEDWDALRVQAERHIHSSQPKVAIESRRMLALAFSRSTNQTEKEKALAVYNNLVAEKEANAEDFANFVLLLIDLRDYEQAKAILFRGIEKFPNKLDAYFEIGLKIVEATGDRAFRNDLIFRKTGKKVQ